MNEKICNICQQFIPCLDNYICCLCSQNDNSTLETEEIEELIDENWTCEHGYLAEVISKKENQTPEKLEIDIYAEKTTCERCGWRRTTRQKVNQPSFWGLNLIFDYLCEVCLEEFAWQMSDQKREMLAEYKEVKRQERI